jgi:hypothetical protein
VLTSHHKLLPGTTKLAQAASAGLLHVLLLSHQVLCSVLLHPFNGPTIAEAAGGDGSKLRSVSREMGMSCFTPPRFYRKMCFMWPSSESFVSCWRRVDNTDAAIATVEMVLILSVSLLDAKSFSEHCVRYSTESLDADSSSCPHLSSVIPQPSNASLNVGSICTIPHYFEATPSA